MMQLSGLSSMTIVVRLPDISKLEKLIRISTMHNLVIQYNPIFVYAVSINSRKTLITLSLV